MRKKWNQHIFQVYELARQGLSKRKISKIIGVSYPCFLSWVQKRKLIKKAYKKGRKANKALLQKNETLSNYIYRHLSDDMREVYDELVEIDKEGYGVSKIEALMTNRGKKFRQRMLLHAYTMMNFNLSGALHRCGVSYAEFCNWKNRDQGFSELLSEIDFHKRNFYEDALNTAVAEGDSQCIIFVNRTYNAERFPEPKQRLQVDKNIRKTVTSITIDSLGLSVEKKRELLERIRQAKQVESREVAALPPVIPLHKETVEIDEENNDDC